MKSLFFFSSRRRHTISKRDWSSDVCSSDLAFKKGKMSFIAQDFDSLNGIAILDGRTQATIRNHFLRYPRKARNRVKVITTNTLSLDYQLTRKLFPKAKVVVDRFHIVQLHRRDMINVRKRIINQW